MTRAADVSDMCFRFATHLIGNAIAGRAEDMDKHPGTASHVSPDDGDTENEQDRKKLLQTVWRIVDQFSALFSKIKYDPSQCMRQLCVQRRHPMTFGILEFIFQGHIRFWARLPYNRKSGCTHFAAGNKPYRFVFRLLRVLTVTDEEIALFERHMDTLVQMIKVCARFP
jgi:hypothetical protein